MGLEVATIAAIGTAVAGAGTAAFTEDRAQSAKKRSVELQGEQQAQVQAQEKQDAIAEFTQQKRQRNTERNIAAQAQLSDNRADNDALGVKGIARKTGNLSGQLFNRGSV